MLCAWHSKIDDILVYFDIGTLYRFIKSTRLTGLTGIKDLYIAGHKHTHKHTLQQKVHTRTHNTTHTHTHALIHTDIHIHTQNTLKGLPLEK